MTDNRQQLYRLFAADGELLYIGVSYSAIARYAQHKVTQPWIGDVARVEIETRDCTRHEIEAAEREAIIAERPRHNVVHNGPTKVQPARAPRESAGERSRWLAIGDVVALGMKDGSCPVGQVAADSFSDPRLPASTIVLDLLDFWSGYFGATQQIVYMGDVVRGMAAEIMSATDKFFEGYPKDATVYDTAPLGRFQTRWKNRVTAA
jgi:hypothetical protein